jgi:hypothetical protein
MHRSAVMAIAGESFIDHNEETGPGVRLKDPI